MSCPFDCEHLREARKHEKPADFDESQLPNRDIRVPERFIEDHEHLLLFLGDAIAAGAMNTAGAMDFDVREALQGLIRTYRTLQSGVYYESVPPNPLAAAIFQSVRSAVEQLQEQESKAGETRTRDADVLGVLVFLQRLEYGRNNGRKLGRAFLQILREIHASRAPEGAPAPPGSLILP